MAHYFVRKIFHVRDGLAFCALIELARKRGDAHVPVRYFHYHYNKGCAWVRVFPAECEEEALNTSPFGDGSVESDRPTHRIPGGLVWLHFAAVMPMNYRFKSGIPAVLENAWVETTPPVDFA